ncbi:hypothetical protein DL764_006414 [Monosporascus ibericus]|uniref:Peptidase C14 caspase domain-containing protein n=1 Tax=Monosporascus ibericus TaxID=155417 RepID=A0A4Q4T545_9PEZI|nr:hypothetical protein DL764_006414 [Monosporascus ibericus]
MVLKAAVYSPFDLSSRRAPTKKNVVEALEALENEEPGAFIYFHYSGHGDSYPTKYPDLKGPQSMDEVICTWEEDIVDSDLGDILDRLAEKHTVCAVLDCCHSGGADRHSGEEGRPRIRHRRAEHIEASTPNDQQTSQASIPRSRGFRNARLFKSELYRDRKYNLIAACQPLEFASEYHITTPQGRKTHGAMTYHLLEALQLLHQDSPTETMTYSQLYGLLGSMMKDNALTQQPMHLGDPQRILFATKSAEAGSAGLLANVVKISGACVTLDKGLSNGISDGDQFRLYPPSAAYCGLITEDDPAAPVVKINDPKDLESTATPYREVPGSLIDVEVGWFARLSKRAKPTIVSVCLPEADPDAGFERIRQDWSSYIDSTLPLDLRFDSRIDEADFFVNTGPDGRILQFRDREKRYIPHLPSIPANGPGNVKQLMGLLKHLSSYKLLAEAGQTSTRSRPPRYHFELLEEKTDKDINPKAVASWRVSFKNLEDRPLYVTILNLGPAYGIQHIYPGPYASSQEIKGKTDIPPEVIIDIEVPSILEDAAKESNFRMRDVVKLFITSKQMNFNHYLLPDLESDPAKLEKRSMRGVPRPPPRMASWVIDAKEIITSRRDDPCPTATDAAPRYDSNICYA